MKVHFVCGYYSDLAHRSHKRPEDYWDAYFYVWAVKVGSFKRKFFIHASTGKKIEVDKSNFPLVRQMFGRFISDRVNQDWGIKIDLVPIPSKDGVVGAADFRTAVMLRECLVGTPFEGKSFDALRWSEQLPKAHQGGSRRRDFLKEHLTTDVKLNGKKIVLVDDLLSTGGSLLASKDYLEEAGAEVLGAVTCGRTIYDFNTKPFGRQTLDLTEELADFGK
jgi:hypothetical protein